MTFVLDASVTLAWFFEDEFDDYSRRTRDALRSDAAMVPWLWAVEVTNGLIVAERQRRITPAKVDTAVLLLDSLPVLLDPLTPPRVHTQRHRPQASADHVRRSVPGTRRPHRVPDRD